jgi:DNA-binding transcriptional ArsR family regulator
MFWYSICMGTQIEDPTSEQVVWASETFKLLADPTRLRIVWTLLHGEHSVNSLAKHVGAQPSAVSQHLAKLHLARVVKKRRQGTFFYYSIQNEHLRRLATEALFSADHAVSDLPPGHEHRPVAVSTGETP